jgi:hypothetical protein
MLRYVDLVVTDVSEEGSASIIRVTRIDVLGTTLAVTGDRCKHSSFTAVKTSNFTYSVQPKLFTRNTEYTDIAS